ncbi:hypothetical protein HDU76_003778 [Blyttiomyces sp. JEL0837]|nr:hypothetical protein HDU76_003778 [Blyttiomyces sp. JEL0837]
MKTFSVIALIASYACRLVAAAPTSANIERRGFTNQYPYGSSDVSIINTIDHQVVLATSYEDFLTDYSFDVQFAVKNKAFAKQVGVRYSNDSWAHQYEAFAQYNSNLDNGYELWSLTVDRGPFWNFEYDKVQAETEIAAFVAYNKGPRAWDPANNYYIRNKATQQNPIHFVDQALKTDANTGTISLTGYAHAFAFDKTKDFAPGAVQIHWSIDNWNTTHDTAAVYVPATKTWNWDFVIANVSAPFPYMVKYAIRYTCSQGSFWDNNSNNDYFRFVAPICDAYIPDLNQSKGPTQVYIECYSQNQHIPNLGLPYFHIDNNPVEQLTLNSQYDYVNATALALGQHTSEIYVYFPGSSSVVLAKDVRTFNVAP